MVTQMVKVPTLLEHLSIPPGFSGVYVTRHLILCVRFCRSLFVPFFSLCHFAVCPSTIYDF
jgi:hypothetical protein